MFKNMRGSQKVAALALILLALVFIIGTLAILSIARGSHETDNGRASPLQPVINTPTQFVPLDQPLPEGESVEIAYPDTYNTADDHNAGGGVGKADTEAGGYAPDVAPAPIQLNLSVPEVIPVFVTGDKPIASNRTGGGGAAMVDDTVYTTYLQKCGLYGEDSIDDPTAEQLTCMRGAPSGYDTNTMTYYDEYGQTHSLYDAPPIVWAEREYDFAELIKDCHGDSRLFATDSGIECRQVK